MKWALLGTPVYIYVWPSQELSKNPTQLPKMLTYLFILFTALSWVSLPTNRYRVSLLTSEMSDPLLQTDCFSALDCFGASSLTDWPSPSFSSGLTGFHGHSCLCGLHTKADKGIPWDTDTGQRCEKSLLWLPIHKHRLTHIHLHIYMYIYIYIYSHPQTDLFRSIRTHQCG